MSHVHAHLSRPYMSSAAKGKRTRGFLRGTCVRMCTMSHMSSFRKVLFKLSTVVRHSHEVPRSNRDVCGLRREAHRELKSVKIGRVRYACSLPVQGFPIAHELRFSLCAPMGSFGGLAVGFWPVLLGLCLRLCLCVCMCVCWCLHFCLYLYFCLCRCLLAFSCLCVWLCPCVSALLCSRVRMCTRAHAHTCKHCGAALAALTSAWPFARPWSSSFPEWWLRRRFRPRRPLRCTDARATPHALGALPRGPRAEHHSLPPQTRNAMRFGEALTEGCAGMKPRERAASSSCT